MPKLVKIVSSSNIQHLTISHHSIMKFCIRSYDHFFRDSAIRVTWKVQRWRAYSSCQYRTFYYSKSTDTSCFPPIYCVMNQFARKTPPHSNFKRPFQFHEEYSVMMHTHFLGASNVDLCLGMAATEYRWWRGD